MLLEATCSQILGIFRGKKQPVFCLSKGITSKNVNCELHAIEIISARFKPANRLLSIIVYLSGTDGKRNKKRGRVSLLLVIAALHGSRRTGRNTRSPDVKHYMFCSKRFRNSKRRDFPKTTQKEAQGMEMTGQVLGFAGKCFAITLTDPCAVVIVIFKANEMQLFHQQRLLQTGLGMKI